MRWRSLRREQSRLVSAVAGVRERATELEGAIAVRLAGFEARLRFAAGRLSVAEAMRQQAEPSDTPQNVPVPLPQHQLLTQASLRRLPAAELAAEVERLSHERASLAARLARAMRIARSGRGAGAGDPHRRRPMGPRGGGGNVVGASSASR